MSAPVVFTVWSDFLCPWCFVAAVRLHAVREEVGDDVLRVEWRSFLLRPSAEPRDPEKFRRYTEHWARPAAAEPRARFRTWTGDAAPPSHSMPPAIGGKVAGTFGEDAFDRFHLALMDAYFAGNRTVSDLAVMVDVAASVGIDAREFAARCERDRDAHERAVVADHRAALAEGIAAVPTVVVAGEHVLTGALSVEQYRKILGRLAS